MLSPSVFSRNLICQFGELGSKVANGTRLSPAWGEVGAYSSCNSFVETLRMQGISSHSNISRLISLLGKGGKETRGSKGLESGMLQGMMGIDQSFLGMIQG